MPVSLRPLLAQRPGRSIFSEDGQFLDCEPGAWFPVELAENALAEARQALYEHDRWLAPAKPERIAARVATLLAHYWVGQMPASLQTAVASDWIEDLREFPAHVIDEAARKWRRMETRRPTPAAVRDLCQRIVATHRRHRDQLRQLVEFNLRESA
ncbi:MAG TPA: hypothetical protein VF234_10830 [Limnochordia bacterium]